MISEEARIISSQCRHYAMCKIDFLGTGLCPAGSHNHYVSYYPQGRMDIYNALANGLIPVTEALVDIADTCSLCGICDRQCYFVTGLRPLKVMKALKGYVENHLKQKGKIETGGEDAVLKGLRGIVGRQWATSDPAILVSYAHDPSPFTGIKIPGYVVMPGTKEEISRIVILCNEHAVNYAVRGNGSSVIGLVFSDGIVIDVNRMKGIRIDRDNWCVHTEAGVCAFDLQKKVYGHGLRVNVAEPSALVCANIMCSGIFSLFSNAYGIAADNYVFAEFVDSKGNIFESNKRTAPNILAFHHEEMPSPGICTMAAIKLHQATSDEEGILIPFADFKEALTFARDLSMRRIGIAIGVLGTEYTAAFMSPTADLAERVKGIISEKLGIQYLVLVIGDRYAIDSIKKMQKTIIDNRLFRMLMLSLPKLAENEWIDLLCDCAPDRDLYEILCRDEMYPLLEAVLTPSPELASASVDDDLKDFFISLYSRPEMTDLIWLNMFRIISSRMGRDKHVLAIVLYLPLDRMGMIEHLNSELKRIGDACHIKGDYGFLTPLDSGKRAVYEYDFYMDHTAPLDIERAKRAMPEVRGLIEGVSRGVKGITWIQYILHQGFARKEHFLYT